MNREAVTHILEGFVFGSLLFCLGAVVVGDKADALALALDALVGFIAWARIR